MQIACDLQICQNTMAQILVCFDLSPKNFGGVVVERPPRVSELAGSIPGRVIPKPFKKEVMAALIGAQGCGVRITTDLLVLG